MASRRFEHLIHHWSHSSVPASPQPFFIESKPARSREHAVHRQIVGGLAVVQYLAAPKLPVIVLPPMSESHHPWNIMQSSVSRILQTRAIYSHIYDFAPYVPRYSVVVICCGASSFFTCRPVAPMAGLRAATSPGNTDPQDDLCSRSERPLLTLKAIMVKSRRFRDHRRFIIRAPDRLCPTKVRCFTLINHQVFGKHTLSSTQCQNPLCSRQ